MRAGSSMQLRKDTCQRVPFSFLLLKCVRPDIALLHVYVGSIRMASGHICDLAWSIEKNQTGVVYFSKRDFSPFMMRLLAYQSHSSGSSRDSSGVQC